MARPLRILAPGLVHHVLARGNNRQRIFLDAMDYRRFLDVLERTFERSSVLCLAYCLMPNHYHLVLETRAPNLSVTMRQLNGVYAQWWNRRHERVGHVFQGRFKSQLIGDERHLRAVCRYVALNPVRAELTRRPSDWRWNSYGPTVAGSVASTPVDVARLAALLSSTDGPTWRRAYRAMVEHVDASTLATDARLAAAFGHDELFIGDEALPRRFSRQLAQASAEVPLASRVADRPSLSALSRGGVSKSERDRLMRVAWQVHGYGLREIGAAAGLHYSTVSRIVNLESKQSSATTDHLESGRHHREQQDLGQEPAKTPKYKT